MRSTREPSHPLIATVILAVLLSIFALAAALLVSRSGDAPAAAQDDELSVIPPLPLTPAAGFDDWTTGIADHDGSIVVTANPPADAGNGAETIAVFHDGVTGQVLAEVPTGEEDLNLRAVSTHGTLAALAKVDDGATTIVVVSLDQELERPRVQVHTLPGRIEPEAFTTDSAQLYVIDHSAGTEPGTYRVRPLDLASGALGETVGPDKSPLDVDMSGYGSRQVWSPDGTRLYTLYTRHTHFPADAGAGAGAGTGAGSDGFVHVLDLAEEWAYCLDLPTQFGDGDVAASALAVAPDGNNLAVVDVEADSVVYASTLELEVTDIVDLPFDIAGPVYLAYDGPDHVIVGSGNTVTWLDRSSGTVVGSQELSSPLEGLSPGPPQPFAYLSTGDSVELTRP